MEKWIQALWNMAFYAWEDGDYEEVAWHMAALFCAEYEPD